jgi:hypothetical protein
MLTIGDQMPAFALRAVLSLERGRELGVRTNQSYPGNRGAPSAARGALRS